MVDETARERLQAVVDGKPYSGPLGGVTDDIRELLRSNGEGIPTISAGELARIGREHLQAGNIDDALTAFNRILAASSAPGEDAATEADFEQIAGLIEHAKQFNPPACYVHGHLFEPLNRIIATARAALSGTDRGGE